MSFILVSSIDAYNFTFCKGRMMQMSHQSCSNVSKNGSINSTKVQSQSNQNGSMNSTKVSSQSNHSPHSLVGLVSNTQHELCDFDAETDDEVHSMFFFRI